MIIADLSRAVLVVILPFISIPELLIFLIALHSLITAFFRPALHTLVPSCVTVSELSMANATLSLTHHFMRVAASVLATLLLFVIPLKNIFFIDAATFVLSAIFLYAIQAKPRDIAQATREKQSPTQGAIAYILGNSLVLCIFIAYIAHGIGGGFHNTLEVGLVIEIIKAPARLYFYITAASGLGAVLSAWLYPKIARPITHFKIAIIFTHILVAILFVLYAYSGSLIIAAANVLFGNFIWVMATISMTTRLQKEVPARLRGRVFSLEQNSFFPVLYICSGLGGFVGDAWGIQFGLVLGGIAMMVVLLSSVFLMKTSLSAGGRT
jgi:predicted MFS family arabinose efflux permease